MSKIKVEIKSIWGTVLYQSEKETVKEAVVDANLRGANLRDANLRDANLYGANLRGANLRGADLRDANLRGANLYDANLYGANLRGANLRGANLYDANLRGADLRGADLRDANLYDANLYGANLRGADLRDADLNKLPQDYINQASRDMLFIFSCLRSELPGLRKAVIEGRIDGSQYEGECACLIGTLGNVDGGVDNVCNAIPYYEKGIHNAGEAWFLNIHKGDTPENNQFSAHVLKLIDSVLPPKVRKSVKKAKK